MSFSLFTISTTYRFGHRESTVTNVLKWSTALVKVVNSLKAVIRSQLHNLFNRHPHSPHLSPRLFVGQSRSILDIYRNKNNSNRPMCQQRKVCVPHLLRIPTEGERDRSEVDSCGWDCSTAFIKRQLFALIGSCGRVGTRILQKVQRLYITINELLLF